MENPEFGARLTVVHLVDDTTAGGVMRVLDYLTQAPEMAQTAFHVQRAIKRGAVCLDRIKADVIVSHLSISWRSLPALIALRIANLKPALIHVEHSYTENFVRLKVAHKARFRTLLRCAFTLFDKIIAVSEGQAAWLQKEGFTPRHKLQTIRSCVDLSAFRALPALPRRPRIFGAIGRLGNEKGFDLLILAFRRIADPDLRLHIYGEGPEKTKLRQMAGEDRRILFKGFTPDPVAAMATLDAVIMPSRYEAYGLVAIEALSAGRPLLTSGVDGLADHRRGGATNLGPLTAKTLSAKIAALAQTDFKALKPSCYRGADILEQEFRQNWNDLLLRCRKPCGTVFSRLQKHSL